MNLLIAFIVAMGITMALIPPLMRRAGAWRVLDAPGDRKVHAAVMPRVGGIAMVVGALVPLLLWLPLDRPSAALLAAGTLVFLFGVWDDRANLSPAAKFIGQLLAVFVAVFGGDVLVGSVSLTERIALPDFIALPLTVFFLLGATNAINLADGLDGLAGGTTLLCMAAIAVLARASGVEPVAALAVVMAGSILGFLRFNTYPARVFMGDGGSQFLGFMVGVLAIRLTQQPSAVLSSALPLLLLGLPVVDTLMVMLQRLREGGSPFAADRKHIHHKLLGLGFDHHEAVIVIYVIQSAFFLAAWFMRFESDLLILAVFALLAFGVVGVLIGAGRLGWRWRHPQAGPQAVPAPQAAPESALRRGLRWLAQPERLPRWALRTCASCVLLYGLAVALLADAVPVDLAWLAVALCALLVVGAIVALRAGVEAGDRFEWLRRGSLYVAATLAVYVDHVSMAKPDLLQALKLTVLPLLALCVMARMRLSRERRFRLTTLDLLLIFVAIAIPNLPGLEGASSNLGLSVAKLMVIVYGIELLADQSRRGEVVLSTGAAGFLAVVAVRGFA